MKRISLTAILLLCISVFAFSQTDVRLRYAETITRQDLKKQLAVVASAGMEGRETGTEGQRKAAAYIESQFRETGLEYPQSLKGFQQHYSLFRDTLVPRSLRIGKTRMTYGKDYLLQPGSITGDKIRAREIVFAGYGIEDKNYDDYAGKNVKGKMVLIVSGEPQVAGKFIISGTGNPGAREWDASRKAAIAKEKGAVAVLLIDPMWDSMPEPLAGSSKRTPVHFPKADDRERLAVITLPPAFLKTIAGTGPAALILETMRARAPFKGMTMYKKMKAKLAFKKARIPGDASNIIGYIEGTDKKNEYVFLTAHYDHLGMRGNVIYYGADDDGSGTVSVIEMARAFARAKQDGHGPRRTVVFMTVSGEEEGLWGSAYYCDHPVFPLDHTTADLNTDMIGRIDPHRTYGDSNNYIYVVGNDKLSSGLDPISKEINRKYTGLELDYTFNASDDPEMIFYRSDHYNFARKGVPIIFFFDGIHKDYHKPSDTVDKINFDLMEKRARFIFLNAWEMANRNDMLRRDIPLPEEER
jgi:hypothetical protein